MDSRKISRFALVASLCCVAVNAVMAAGFTAGYSKVDITPGNGTPISGYYSPRLSEGALDPLYACCVAMSDGEKTAFVISVDNLQLDTSIIDRIKDCITSKTKVSGDAIFIACTHTHTGAAWTPGWAKGPEAKARVEDANNLLVAGCTAAAAKAMADMAPSKILVGRGEAKDISFIRRFKMKDGTFRTNPGCNNPNVEGPVGEPDETLQLVRFVREGAKEIALLNFQCHPDVIGGNKFSADWPGLSCAYLESAFNGGVHAILINGAQGDTNHFRVRWKVGDPLPLRYEMSHHMARTVAGSAMKVWGFCREVPAGKVNAAVRMVTVKVNKGEPSDLPRAREWRQLHLDGKGGKVPGVGMERTANVAWAYRVVQTSDWPDERPLPVTVITVGKALAFGGFPGEPFTDMGRGAKSRSKFAMTIPACCAGGSFGYFPMQDAYTIGGYENATSRYAKGTAEKLVDGMVDQMNEFYDKAE